jgi:hypothetical protein
MGLESVEPKTKREPLRRALRARKGSLAPTAMVHASPPAGGTTDPLIRMLTTELDDTRRPRPKDLIVHGARAMVGRDGAKDCDWPPLPLALPAHDVTRIVDRDRHAAQLLRERYGSVSLRPGPVPCPDYSTY